MAVLRFSAGELTQRIWTKPTVIVSFEVFKALGTETREFFRETLEAFEDLMVLAFFGTPLCYPIEVQ